MTTFGQPPEFVWIGLAVAAYAGASACAMLATSGSRGLAASRRAHRGVAILVGVALALLAGGIATRWLRIGHGPFLSMFEVLASSLWSLGAIYALACWRLPVLRGTAVVVLPVLLVMAAWLLATSSADTHLPPTYETPVLWFHVLLGKAFLGCVLVAVGIAGVMLGRRSPRGAAWFARMPRDAVLDALAWRFMLSALVFESFMLIAGAVWAQDAWGRYWAWDPLETWAFITWLALAGAVHARLAYRVSPRAGAWLILTLFALAFVTFFGVPFISVAPHQGAV